MIRMKDIAARLQVSQTTVSHVLTGKHEQYRISPETVARVRRAAEELGYQSSALARSFRDRRSYSLGLAVEDLTNPFWAGMAVGAEREAEKHGYILVMSHTSGGEERERRAVHMLRERRIDGLIISPMTVTDKLLLDLRKEGLAFVQIDRSVPGLDIPCVRSDQVQGSTLAVNHLAGKGHTSIGYLGGQLVNRMYRLRLEGFKKTMARRGLKTAFVELAEPALDAATAAARKALSGRSRPTALYAANIWFTLGTLRAARELKINIPGDLEVVGFDDIPNADLLISPVSTVAQDLEAIGRESVRLLIRVMNGEKAPREVVIPPKLIVR